MLLHNLLAPFMMMFFFSLAIGSLVIWIWCIIDAIKSDFQNDTQKIIWIILLVTVPVIGAILYLLIGREQQTDRFSDEV